MSPFEEAQQRLARIPSLQCICDEPLARHSRFGLGGPARVFADTGSEDAFVEALRALTPLDVPWAVIGGGTNLICADRGYRGVVLRYRGDSLRRDGNRVEAGAGAVLQDLVDLSLREGLAGLHTMTGIPGFVGAAVYGNAGAYGRSMSDMVVRVRYFNGRDIVETDHAGCGFRYRESVFKRNKSWFILSATLQLEPGDAAELQSRATEIRTIRDAKYPPTMLCAGSIFKNLILAELPANVQSRVPPNIVKGGKVPSAWFLDQVGAKGMRNGGIVVADYHANLIYNDGAATAAQFREVVGDLKTRVRDEFGFEPEEEVQYMGFDTDLPGIATLESTPAVLQGLISSLDPGEMHWKPAGNRWSVAEVLAHLDHVERVGFFDRVRAFVEQDNPILEAYDPDVYQAAGLYDAQPGLASLEGFLRARQESLSYLATVPQSALRRTARHSELGPVTLDQMMNEWAFHDLGHTRQIAELIRAVKYYPGMGPWQTFYTVNP